MSPEPASHTPNRLLRPQRPSVSAAKDEVLEALSQTAALACDASISAINLFGQARHWLGSELDHASQAPSISVCSRAEFKNGVCVMPDLTADARFRHRAPVIGGRRLRFYASALLQTATGVSIGTIYVLDHEPRFEGLTSTQRRILSSLAQAAVHHLETRKTGLLLQRREHELRSIIDAIPHKIWTAGANGEADYFNRRWYEFTGWDPDSDSCQSWTDVVHPDDLPAALSQWATSMQTGSDFECEFRICDRSGSYRWMLARARPMRLEHGDIARWFATCTDIHRTKLAEIGVGRREERYRALIQAGTAGVWIASPEGIILNGWSWDDFTDLPAEAFLGTNWLQTIHPNDLSAVKQRWSHSLSEGSPYEAEFRVQRRSGDYRWVAVRAVPLRDHKGNIREWVGTTSDIHDQRTTEKKLRASDERLRLALQTGRMIAWEEDLANDQITCSANAAALIGFVSGTRADFMRRIRHEDRVPVEEFLTSLTAEPSRTMQFRMTTANGREIWLGFRARRTVKNKIVGMAFDVSDRKAAEQQIWRNANHDSLTGLPNRALFQSRMDDAFREAKRNRTSTSILFIDFDRFKDINDSLGHEAGDTFLKEIARRLQGMVRDCDTVARLGGDEFAVLIVSPIRLEPARRLADIIAERLSEPVTYLGHSLSSAPSIGLAAYPDHETDPSELLKDADIALHAAKSQGGGQIALYHPTLRMAVERRVALFEDVRAALANNEIVPFYQPKVSLLTGHIVGFEVLARWRHPAKGLLSPSYFGPAFDEPPLARAITNRMLSHACDDMRHWLAAGFEPGRLAFNLSSADFSRPDLTTDIVSALNRTGIAANRVEVEVTETVLIGRDIGRIASVLHSLSEKGITIALDDFGTGYASLIHLKQFPISHVKIDSGFIKSLQDQSSDHAIVSSIVDLCKKLGMKVTAEGVETDQQASILCDLECDFGQGFYYAMPVASESVPTLLAAPPFAAADRPFWQKAEFISS